MFVWKFERGLIQWVSNKMSVYNTVFVDSFHFHFDEICISPFPTFIFQFLIENLVQVHWNQQMTGGNL